MISFHQFQACEPVPLFYVIFSWPQAISVYWFAKGFALLLAAILIKAILFCFIGKINPLKGIPVMAAANAVSTIPGVLLAALLAGFPLFVSSPIGWAIGLIVFGLFYFTTQRVAARFLHDLASDEWAFLTPNSFIFGSLALGAISIFLAGVIHGTDFNASGQAAMYWIGKYLALFFGLLSSIALTICWESAVTCTLLERFGKARILRATVFANLFFFFSIFAIGAFLAWPERMRHRDWLLPPR